MPRVPFNPRFQAISYGKLHFTTDPGVREIHYLPHNAPDREIRLVEVNELMAEMRDDCLEPFDMGVDRGEDDEHRLLIMDVTPTQWEKIQQHQIALPNGWSLDHSESIPHPA